MQASLIHGPKELSHWKTGLRTTGGLQNGYRLVCRARRGELWDKAPGRDTKTEVENLTKYAQAAGDVELIDYSAILRGVLSAGQTRDQNQVHSNIRIWGHVGSAGAKRRSGHPCGIK